LVPRVLSQPIPTPGRGQVLVRIHAAAFNRRDYWITQRLYPGIKVPCILGADGCGTVVKVGDSEDSAWLNQEVVMSPILNWGQNEAVPDRGCSVLGMPENGTFAEYLCIGANKLWKKPSHLSAVQASAIPLAGITGYRALFVKGKFQPKQRVLVTGIGSGVAQFVAQFAVLGDGIVWVTSRNQEKIDQAKQQLGVQGGFNTSTKGWSKLAKKETELFDLVVDGVGGNDFNAFIELLKTGGSLVTYGATAGPPARFAVQDIFLRHKNIIGTSLGSDADFSAMMQFIEKTKLLPTIDSVHDYNDLPIVMEKLQKGDQTGKLVITFPGASSKL